MRHGTLTARFAGACQGSGTAVQKKGKICADEWPSVPCALYVRTVHPLCTRFVPSMCALCTLCAPALCPLCVHCAPSVPPLCATHMCIVPSLCFRLHKGCGKGVIAMMGRDCGMFRSQSHRLLLPNELSAGSGSTHHCTPHTAHADTSPCAQYALSVCPQRSLCRASVTDLCPAVIAFGVQLQDPSANRQHT